MAHWAFRIAATKGLAALAGLPIHQSVRDEIAHDWQRRHGGESEIERIGKAWRAAHGFGRPFHTGNAPGSGRGYRYGETHSEAERRAATRKTQKAARIRTKAANAGRAIAAGVRRVFRGAARGQ